MPPKKKPAAAAAKPAAKAAAAKPAAKAAAKAKPAAKAAAKAAAKPAGTKRTAAAAAAKAADAPAAPAKATSKGRAKAAKKDDSPPPPAPAAAPAVVAPAPAAAASSDDSHKVKIIRKGKAPVDQLCRLKNSHHVYADDDEVFDCMLNQTNISANNNKFYVIQLLEADAGGGYTVWNRWGRVGEPGQNAVKPMPSLAAAKSEFMSKFRSKTGNAWQARANFTAKSGLYTLLAMDYGDDQDTDMPDAAPAKAAAAKKDEPAKEAPASKLDPRVQNVVSMIFDLKMMETTMVQMEYDVRKMPLGKLKKDVVKQGYQVLKELEQAMANGQRSELERLSSRFYTLIPHSFGRSVPPIIRTDEMLKQKMQMLEALADIEIATKILADTKADSSADQLAAIDREYARLKTDLKPLDKTSQEYKDIEQYLNSTDSRKNLKLKDVLVVDREGEAARFDTSKHLGNRRLLWHGSRLTNWVGILSTGLRIAPPEAPCTGYRFGKGLYFADQCSLSAMYCRQAPGSTGMLALVDVALGKQYECPRDQFMTKAPAGYDSTWALGRQEPKRSSWLENYQGRGYTIPTGQPGPVTTHSVQSVSCNEQQFVTYDVAQSRIAYLLVCQW